MPASDPRKKTAWMKKPPQEPLAVMAVSNGTKDFREFAYQSEPEWSLYAIESRLEKVAEQLAKLLKGKICSTDILKNALPRPRAMTSRRSLRSYL